MIAIIYGNHIWFTIYGYIHMIICEIICDSPYMVDRI